MPGASIPAVTRTEPRTPATLPPVSLSPEEAAAVAVALAARPDGPYADAGRGALEKVLDALEPDPRRRAHLLATSLWVAAEAERSGEVRQVLERGVTQGRVLVLRYRDGQGRASRRAVEPQLLARTGEHWFLVAWCREREALRWFREDRIEAAELTSEPAAKRDLAAVGAPPSSSHPAGRALRRRSPADETPTAQAAPATPRLRVLPGGRS